MMTAVKKALVSIRGVASESATVARCNLVFFDLLQVWVLRV